MFRAIMSEIAYCAILIICASFGSTIGVALAFEDEKKKRKAIFGLLSFVLGVFLGMLWGYKI